MFIKVKEAFDRLVKLNDEYGGQLLTDPEEELAAQLERQKRESAMHELRMKLAKAKADQRQEDKKRLEQEEDDLRERMRIAEIRRKAVVER